MESFSFSLFLDQLNGIVFTYAFYYMFLSTEKKCKFGFLVLSYLIFFFVNKKI